MGPFLLHLCTGMESGLSSVVCGRKETDPAVNADYPGMAGGIRCVWHFNGDRHMEKELVMLIDKLRGAKLSAVRKCPFHCISMETAFDTALKGTYTEELFSLIIIPNEGIIPVPDKAELWSAELRHDISMALLPAEPFAMPFLVCPDRLIGGDHGTCNTCSHLGRECIGAAAGTVNSVMYPDLAQRHGVVMHIGRDKRAGSRISLHGIEQKLSVLLLMSAAYVIPFSNSIIVYLLENIKTINKQTKKAHSSHD